MSGRAESVLVVEDEQKICDLLRGYLERAGFAVITTASGAEAITLVRREHPDLVILDLRLPHVPGEEVAREVRTFSSVPIMILTAKTAEEDRIRGLELGADDYVTKPFSPREVVLRVRAILRRGRDPCRGRAASFGDGELTIDEEHREVRVRGRVVDLTPTELGILCALARVPGRPYSRYELIDELRGCAFDGNERTIDSHVKNLRQKIERDPHAPRLVVTVLGGGYRLGVRNDG